AICGASEDCPPGQLCNGVSAGFCSTRNIVGCDANCTTPACGNGNVSGTETCDDGNTSNFDSCPSDCIVDTCAPPIAGTYGITVSFAGSSNVAGITVFIDYPEGSVHNPAAATDLPGTAQAVSNDYGHAIQVAVADFASFPAGQLFKMNFQQ